jgi:predicted ATPase
LEVDTQGDAYFAAFPRAREAVAAVVEIQHSLMKRDWPEEVEVRVRMGLHTGEPLVAEEGYVGMDVHRAARIAQVGHGGQVLLSESVVALARDQLPEGVGLRDLGEHRLKDLSRPERIYQLLIPGIPADFPAITSLDSRLNNLPVLLTSFVGREAEIEEIKAWLEKGRLVTIVGPGGVGKTRLSLQSAADLLPSFKDGVWLVELASLTNPDLVLQTVMNVLAIQDTNPSDILSSLVDYLSDRELMFVFDNCEHLIDVCAATIDHILQHCPGVKVLATSRETLEIKGEIVYQAPSLLIPDPDAEKNIDDLVQYESMQLFIDRAKSVKVDFELTSENAPLVAQICCRLDGIPLAIELAAARVKVMPLELIATRLDDRFHLLTGGGRTALSRHQTLQATMDWSYLLLSEKEKILFRRLAVFVGGWTLEAAEVVCSGDEINQSEVLDLLSHLVNKSLIYVQDVQSEGRFRRLETIRQYSLGKLLESEETEMIRNRHLEFFTQVAEKAQPKLVGPEQKEWLSKFEIDHDNFRVALEWSKSSPEFTESGLRLAGALSGFWRKRGYLSEGRERLTAMLQNPMTNNYPLSRAQVLAGAGQLAYLQSDYPATRAAFEESLSLFRSIGAEGISGAASALLGLGNVDTEEGDYVNAPLLFEESLVLSREIGDKAGIADALRNLGWAAMRPGDYISAKERLQEALILFRDTGNIEGIASSLSGLGEIAVRQGEYQQSLNYLEESLDIRRTVGNKWGIAATLGTIAWAALGQGDLDRAAHMFWESLEVRKEIGDKGGLAWCLEKFAEIALLSENVEHAIVVYGAASQLRSSMGSVIDPADQPEYQRRLDYLKSHAGEELFDQIWKKGQSMRVDQVIDAIRDQVPVV